MTALAQRLVAHRVFQGFIIGVILLAGVLARLETDPALVTRWAPWLGWLNGAVLAVFVL
jgi:voltage-gated sodium channel